MGSKLLSHKSVGQIGTKKWKECLLYGLKYEQSLKISKISSDNLDTICEIERLCFDENIRFSKEDYFELINLADIFSLKIEINNQILGFIIWKLNKQKQAEIITINIHPNFRKVGLGSVLLTHFEKYIEKPAEIVLEVAENNQPALNLYKKFKYHKSSYLKNYYGLGRNAFLMTKNLA